MNKFIEKICQRMANRILEKMEKAENLQEVNMLFEIGMILDRWCMDRGIELK